MHRGIRSPKNFRPSHVNQPNISYESNQNDFYDEYDSLSGISSMYARHLDTMIGSITKSSLQVSSGPFLRLVRSFATPSEDILIVS